MLVGWRVAGLLLSPCRAFPWRIAQLKEYDPGFYIRFICFSFSLFFFYFQLIIFVPHLEHISVYSTGHTFNCH